MPLVAVPKEASVVRSEPPRFMLLKLGHFAWPKWLRPACQMWGSSERDANR
jgi:hypothetical protein